MKKLVALLVISICFIQAKAQYGVPCADLFFSEYIEPGAGHSQDKTIEIYNPSASAINLAGYSVKQFSNGSATPTASKTIYGGMLNAGGVYVINIGTGTTTAADSATLIAVRDTIWGSMNFNGNDALMLLSPTNDTLDIFGQIGVNPGTAWLIGTNDSTKDRTLVRNPTVHNGQRNWTIGATEWTGYAVNTLTNLGSHSITPCGPATPTLYFSPHTGSFAESAGTVNIPITMVNATANIAMVTVTLMTGGTATGGGTDFTFGTQVITFPANFNGTQNASFQIIDDALIESSETALLLISNPTNATIGTDSVYTLTILDNDTPTPPTVQFTNTAATVNESAGTISIPVSISSPNGIATSVDVNITGGTATGGGVDFTGTFPATLTFPASSSTGQNATLTIIDDAIIESAETITFNLINATNSAVIGANNSYTITITDNDAVASTDTVTISPASFTMAENGGTNHVTVMLNHNATTPITVTVTATGTATSGSDYNLISSSPVTIGIGNSSVNFLFNVVDDAANEATETIVFTLSAPTGGAVIGSTSACTVSITDNDPLGVNELANGNQQLSIYPNPAKELLVISYPLLGNINTIQVYDAVGREFVIPTKEESKSKAINVANLSSGVYFIKLTDEKGNVRMGKFVKE